MGIKLGTWNSCRVSRTMKHYSEHRFKVVVESDKQSIGLGDVNHDNRKLRFLLSLWLRQHK